MNLVRSAIRMALPYGHTARVLRGPARGMRFVANPGIGHTYALGTRTAAPRFFSNWIHSGDTVYDVGANQGQMSLIFAALVGPTGRVLAFEPSLPEYRRLVTNIRLNDLDNVACFNAAAADFSGDTPFDYHPQFPTQGKMALVEPSYIVSGAARVSVPAITLDSLLGIQPPPHIMKIDVEGAAGSVLRGARTILNSIGPTIFVELHGPEEQAAIRDELLGRGYVAETLEGETILDPTSHWHSPLWCHKPAH